MSSNTTARRIAWSIRPTRSSGWRPTASTSTRSATSPRPGWSSSGPARSWRKAVGDGIPEKVFKQMKRREELLKKLTEMYNATLEYLLPDEDDEGNVDWTATL